MNKSIIIKSIFSLLVFLTVYAFAGTAYLQVDDVYKEKIVMFPVPDDYRNYFFLQSVNNATRIVIGDFTGQEKIISLIIDNGCDNKIDEILDYYPETKIYKTPKKSKSQFFTENMEQMKRDIIEGKIFQVNYSYKMGSYDSLKAKIENGIVNVRKEGYGYRVIVYDTDAPNSIMEEFYFSQRLGKYDLAFRTAYYKIFNTRIYPPLEYSVYCKETTDPVVKDIVDSLLKIVKQ